MTEAIAQSFLDRNLRCLAGRNDDVARRIAAADGWREISFHDTPQGVISATYDGRRLASAHRPLEEAQRLADQIDVSEHAVVVVLGFGLGHHVRALAERMGRTGVIVVFEPDVALLRAVMERIDHSPWLERSLVAWITDPDDRAGLATKLNGAEAIVAQGVGFLEHPEARGRIREQASRFSAVFKEFVDVAKTTLLTTLIRSVNTIENLTRNLDHYAGGDGVAPLKGALTDRPAVIVSAGPSLRKNIDQLAGPGVRDRCAIIAVQTTLKPLLAAGVRPHFVTALDYHEISKRFYEGLSEQDLEGVTLVADPKVHSSVIDIFPGAVRCCRSEFLDRLLGDVARPMGDLPAGATVAHLAFYLARYLGCNPIALIGQDLGFTDGLYYARGTAIDEIWAPELNPFNTIEMMEWQRIARHRVHLHKTVDQSGKSIYTDAQMLTYLQQFERDFARAEADGTTVIDATEGGVKKQHTQVMPLRRVLEEFATRPLPTLPAASRTLDHARLSRAHERVTEVRRDMIRLRKIALKTQTLLQTMLEHQSDRQRMAGLFQKVEAARREVNEVFDAFEMLNLMNQLAVFKRHRHDRRLHLAPELDDRTRQRRQLERDLENVTWTADAAAEMIDMLEQTGQLLAGERIERRTRRREALAHDDEPAATARVLVKPRVAALIPVDPCRNGLGVERSLAEPFRGRPVLEATIARLARSKRLESIVLIVPDDLDVDRLVDRTRTGVAVEIERCPAGARSPFGPEQEAIAAARLWSDTCWRGGIAGMSVYDEVLCPGVMGEIMERRGLTACVLVGPDWPFVDAGEHSGCDALVARHLEQPKKHNLVFTQAPPGLGGCLLTASLMKELALRNRLATVGGLLVYQPHAPQHDPIARDANVQIDHRVRTSLIRATFDSARQRALLERALARLGESELDDADATRIVEAIEHAATEIDLPPQHFIVELCAERTSHGHLAAMPDGSARRDPMSDDVAERIFEAAGRIDDCVLTFGGAGDPLLHPRFDDFVRRAKAAGARAIHVRTELLCDREVLDRLIACPVDVVSVDLHADRAATYRAMMGFDRFKEVLENMEHLLLNRRRFTPHEGGAAIGLPWIVPRLQRRHETYEDIDTFFDRWQAVLGTAVIEGVAGAPDPSPGGPAPLASARAPRHVVRREGDRRVLILSDGSVPLGERDRSAKHLVGRLTDATLDELWNLRRARRDAIRRDLGDDAPILRTAWP